MLEHFWNQSGCKYPNSTPKHRMDSHRSHLTALHDANFGDGQKLLLSTCQGFECCRFYYYNLPIKKYYIYIGINQMIYSCN